MKITLKKVILTIVILVVAVFVIDAIINFDDIIQAYKEGYRNGYNGR
ncbi:MAG: hypothetical protein ABFS35_20885 [Bacteroidota bacterium]